MTGRYKSAFDLGTVDRRTMVNKNVQDCRSHGGRIENRRLQLGVAGCWNARRDLQRGKKMCA